MNARAARMEEWLYDRWNSNPPIKSFSQAEYAADLGLDGWEATGDIRAYQDEVRRRPKTTVLKDGTVKTTKGSESLFVIHREPGTRTSRAVWNVGDSTANARSVGRSFYSDVEVKVMDAFQPTLLRIAERNPRAAKQVEAQIKGTTTHALGLMEMAMVGLGLNEDEQR